MIRMLWATIVVTACLLAVRASGEAEYNDCPNGCKCLELSFTCQMSCQNLRLDRKVEKLPVTHFEINQSDEPLSLTASVFANLGITHVNSITIYNSSVTSVDKSAFRQLNELSTVKLAYCGISKLHPETFTKNSNLKKLVLKGNPLILDEFVTSKTIEELDISNCHISFVNPSVFKNLLQLTYLDLSGNNIEKLVPESFSLLNELEEINLSNNKITELSTDLFSKNPNLDVLNLSENPLVTFNGDSLSSLVVLNLHSCQLKQVDSDMFKNMKDLTDLILSNNMITNISPNAFDDLIELNVIDLSNNDLRVLNQNVFSHNPSLQKINLDNNARLGKLPVRGFRTNGNFQTHHISCNNCNLQSLPKDVFSSMPALVKLQLSNNKISDVSTGVFKTLTSLVELDLSHNEIITIDDNTFVSNKDLHKLSLSHNPLKALHASMLRENTNLEYLDVSNCGLYKLWTAPADSLKLSSVMSLNISDNHIRIISKEDVMVTDHLKTLDISNNPLDCSESLKELMIYLHEQDVKRTPYVTNEKKSYDFEDRQKEDDSWKELVRTRCPDLIDFEDEDEDEDDYDEDDYNEDDLDETTESEKLITDDEIGDIVEDDDDEINLEASKYQFTRYSYLWPVLMFIGTALAVLGIVANLILFVIRRPQTFPIQKIINVGVASKMKKNSGLVYQQLSEEHGPKTPILNRFTPIPAVHNPNEPENV